MTRIFSSFIINFKNPPRIFGKSQYYHFYNYKKLEFFSQNLSNEYVAM